MNSKITTSTFLEISIRFEKEQPNGETKKATERYVIEAESFSEAEARTAELASNEGIYDYELRSAAQANYNEIVSADASNELRWYKTKVSFLATDENADKEKRYSKTYLVQGSSLLAAVKNIENIFKGSILDYRIASILETKNIDVLFHEEKGK